MLSPPTPMVHQMVTGLQHCVSITISISISMPLSQQLLGCSNLLAGAAGSTGVLGFVLLFQFILWISAATIDLLCF